MVSRNSRKLRKSALLRRVLGAVGAVERERSLPQVGRQRDVQHPPGQFAQPGDGQRGLARTRGARHHQRQRQPRQRLLRVVEHDGLVQQLELRALRVQPAQRRELGLGHRRSFSQRLVLDLGLVHRCAEQEARALVDVVEDHLQRQAHHLAVDARELQQQPVGIVQPRAVVRPRIQLLHVRRAEVAGLDGGAHLVEGRSHAAQVEILVLEQTHGLARRSEKMPDQ
jgi:hypothetical protein